MTVGLPQQRTCGTMGVHYRLLTTDLTYARNRQEIENRSLEYARRGIDAARTGITVIPIVVHVVHNPSSPEQNISEAQIRSQIDVLNRDFRKQNPDIASIPAAFQPLAVDVRIEFVLATTDPNGNPTNGITRTATTAAAFMDDDSVKFAARGGADAWPSDRYLNMWVCQLGGGLLGYAQFPGGPAATDGVVITHTGFGTTDTAAAPFNLGRTATHEIGHWLNLRHIWGDDGNGCNGSDFADDTPNQAGANFGKPSFPHVTCSNGPNGDMFMNYMDYTDDVAMFMFTAGQVVRIQAVLDNERASIGTTRSDNIFQIESKYSGKCLDLSLADGPDTVNGTNVWQWDCQGSDNDNQRWILIPQDDGSYQIESKYSGKCLDLSLADGPDTINGTNVWQWDWQSENNDNQRWILIPQDDGSYQIESKYSGKCLDLSLADGPDTVNGTNVWQWDWQGGDNGNQRWILIPSP